MGRKAGAQRNTSNIEHYLGTSEIAEDGIACFLEDNKGLLMEMAIRRFGPHRYGELEVMGVGYDYAHSALQYLNRWQGQRISTVAQWFFSKAINALGKGGLIFEEGEGSVYAEDEVSENAMLDLHTFSNAETDQDDEFDAFDADEAALYLPDAEKHEDHLYADHLNIHICLESFLDKVPFALYQALRDLNTGGIANIYSAYESTKINPLKSRITKDLIKALKGAGSSIYLGTVKNGSISDVVVCAETEEEAVEYFRLYGATLKTAIWQGLAKRKRAKKPLVGIETVKTSTKKVATKEVAPCKQITSAKSLRKGVTRKKGLPVKQIQLFGTAA